MQRVRNNFGIILRSHCDHFTSICFSLFVFFIFIHFELSAAILCSLVLLDCPHITVLLTVLQAGVCRQLSQAFSGPNKRKHHHSSEPICRVWRTHSPLNWPLSQAGPQGLPGMHVSGHFLVVWDLSLGTRDRKNTPGKAVKAAKQQRSWELQLKYISCLDIFVWFFYPLTLFFPFYQLCVEIKV